MDIRHFCICLTNGKQKDSMTYRATDEGISRDWNSNKIKSDEDFKKWFVRICHILCVKTIDLSVHDTRGEIIKISKDFDTMIENTLDDEARRNTIEEMSERDVTTIDDVYERYYLRVVIPFIDEIDDTSTILKITKKLIGQECCILHTPLTHTNTRVFKHCEHMISDEAYRGMRNAKHSAEQGDPDFSGTCGVIECPLCRCSHKPSEVLHIRKITHMDT